MVSGYGGSANVINPLATLIAPLAALALLGAATAVALNPVLLQIAVVTGKKRRKRNAEVDPEAERKMQEIEKLEKFLSKAPNVENSNEELFANYVSCSGLAINSQCLEHLSCIYTNPKARIPATNTVVSEAEKQVIAMYVNPSQFVNP